MLFRQEVASRAESHQTPGKGQGNAEQGLPETLFRESCGSRSLAEEPGGDGPGKAVDVVAGQTRPTRAVALASRAPRVKLPTLTCLQDLGYSHVLGACSATALITGMGWEASSVRSSLRARVPHW